MGGFNGLKMLIARGDGPRIGTLARRIGTTAFFGMHYGTFWTVHGVFVWTFLPLFAQSRGVGLDDTRRGLESTVSLGPDAGAVVLGAIVLALSHGASFLFNYIGRGEYLRMTVARQMGAPYGRVVALHLAILGGGVRGLRPGNADRCPGDPGAAQDGPRCRIPPRRTSSHLRRIAGAIPGRYPSPT